MLIHPIHSYIYNHEVSEGDLSIIRLAARTYHSSVLCGMYNLRCRVTPGQAIQR